MSALPSLIVNGLISMMETIFDPRLGLMMKVDWGATIMDLSKIENTFARSWDCRLRITPNRWGNFSYLWKIFMVSKKMI